MSRPSVEVTPIPREPRTVPSGLGDLRDGAGRWLRQWLPMRGTAREDVAAGMSLAVGNVPDGMANGFLVGVNPIHGLYATMIAPIVGGALSSTRLMVITTTAAASLTASQPLSEMPPEARTAALFVMVVLAGLFQVAFGLLGFARLTRFVSHSVTTGFLTGVSVLLVLSQLPTIAGYTAIGANRVLQTLDLITHVRAVDPASLAMGTATIGLALVLPRTPLRGFGRLVAVIVPSAMVALLGFDGVAVVRDLGEIQRAMPAIEMPSLVRLAPGVLTGALSIAAVVMIQSVGVSQSVPNPDGTRSNIRQDIIAQGIANVASGIVRGLPVGGSVSSTALSVVSGARTQWAAIFAGLWMAFIVFGVPGLVANVAMPALGALLILAGASSIRPRELVAVWYTGWHSRFAAVTAFLGTLFLPIQAAVGLGVVMAALLYVNEASTDIAVVQLVPRDDGAMEERAAPTRLEGGRVTVLDVYGQLFFAGARTLESLLPRPRGKAASVVILRLRGRTLLGATLLDVLTRYADELQRAEGRLFLTGLSKEVHEQVLRTGKLGDPGMVRIYEGTPVVGESTRRAIAEAERWLASRDAP